MAIDVAIFKNSRCSAGGALNEKSERLGVRTFFLTIMEIPLARVWMSSGEQVSLLGIGI